MKKPVIQLFSVLLAASVPLLPTQAASDTWDGTGSDGLWSNGDNWVSGTAPGTTGSTTNTDTATFNSAAGSNTTITVDAGRNLQFFDFNTSAASYTFTGGSFDLTAGSAVTLANTLSGATTQTFASDIALNGATTFTNNSATSNFVLSGGISAASSASLAFNGTGATQTLVSGPITGAVNVDLSGSAKVKFTGASNYSGTTTVTSVDAGTATTAVFEGSNAGSGNYVFTGTGNTVELNGAVNGGLGTGQISLSSTNLKSAADVTLTNAIVAPGNWNYVGEHKLTFAGDYLVNLATVRAISNANGGTVELSKVFLSSSTQTSNASELRFGHQSNNALRQGNFIANGVIANTQAGGTATGSVSVYADANRVYSVTLNADNTFSGGLTHGSGLLNIGNAGALGTGTVTWAGTSSTNTTIDNTSGGALVNANNNNVVFNTANGVYAFKGSNDYDLGTGAVAVTQAQNGMTINLEGTNSTLSTGTWTNNFTGAANAIKIAVNNNNGGSGNKLVMRGLNISNTASTQTATISGSADVDITGVIANGGTAASGNMIFGVAGSTGTYRLTAANTYSGTTTVTAGTLLIDGSIGSGAVSVAAAATLGGSGSVGGTVTTAAGGAAIISPGGGGDNSLSLNALNAASGVVFKFDLASAGGDLLNITNAFTGSTATGGLVFNFTQSGPITLNSAITLINFGSSSGLDLADLTYSNSGGIEGVFGLTGNSVTFTVTAVPEPSTAALILGAFGAIAALRRRLAD